jgi:hypothetical protein
MGILEFICPKILQSEYSGVVHQMLPMDGHHHHHQILCVSISDYPSFKKHHDLIPAYKQKDKTKIEWQISYLLQWHYGIISFSSAATINLTERFEQPSP